MAFDNLSGGGTMNEAAYNTMKHVGGGSIALGVIAIAAGIAVGVLSIVNGARLLSRKSSLTF